MVIDHWLVVMVATLNIGFAMWLAFFAIHWRTVAAQQQQNAKQLSDWINDRLPIMLKEIEDGTVESHSDGPR